MGLKWSPAAGMLLVATVCIVAGMLLPAGDIAGLAGRIILYLLLVTAIYLMPVWHGNDREMMKAGVGKLRNLVLSRRT